MLYFFLFGLNLLIWDRARVNYVFIFGKDWKSSFCIFIRRLNYFQLDLDCSNRLDYQQYFEAGFLVQHPYFYNYLRVIGTKPAPSDIVLRVLGVVLAPWGSDFASHNLATYMVDFYDPHCCSPHTRTGKIATILVYQDFFETFPVGNATSRGQLYSFPILVWKSSHILIVVRRFLDGVKLSYSLYFLF